MREFREGFHIFMALILTLFVAGSVLAQDPDDDPWQGPGMGHVLDLGPTWHRVAVVYDNSPPSGVRVEVTNYITIPFFGKVANHEDWKLIDADTEQVPTVNDPVVIDLDDDDTIFTSTRRYAVRADNEIIFCDPWP